MLTASGIFGRVYMW